MPLPQKIKKHYELTRVEKAIAVFMWLEKPTTIDLNNVTIAAQIQTGINKYRADAQGMTDDELKTENHNSSKLAEHMTVTGDPRPHKLCDAHALISGAHPLASGMRAILAWYRKRIDDPINGCWLPRNTEAKKHMPSWLASAVPHSRIHRRNMYHWLSNSIDMKLIKNEKQLEDALKMAEFRLQTSTFPRYVMLPAGQKT